MNISKESTREISHENNFDFLRILFALFVLITHCYPLSGVPEEDFLFKISNGQTTLSYVGVRGFFIISGYLIMKSLLRSDDLFDFYWKRSLRIFPALWVIVILSVIGGYWISSKNVVQYVTDSTTIRYLLSNLILKVEYNIDGVFAANPYPEVVNGSLWTIPYEFMFYCVLSLFFGIKDLRNLFLKYFLTLYGLFILYYIYLWNIGDNIRFTIPFYNIDSKVIAEFGLFFFAGSVLVLFDLPFIKYKNIVICSSVIVIISSLVWGGFFITKFTALPLLVIYFGISRTGVLSKIRKFGDPSYGLYLWGFPVQQTIVYFFKPTVGMLMLLSIPVVIVLAYISWFLVEKKFMKIKSIYPKAYSVKQLV
ncbi:acyltransferase [Hymenobacter sp. GOD-10R]|uniref:acyltransferase family protein n=1 Tax=Hymenobacter sp. GOD-10R TaxID=3093922 RepID=UPI002D78D520|nr:acyltransferase [Hymenobacter sp. GOD-10R]WRQ27451.1 acyltransferase [Hymenobacter sp. GOD-10R]